MGMVIYPNKKGKHHAKPIMIGNIYRLQRKLVKKYTEFINEFSQSQLD